MSATTIKLAWSEVSMASFAGLMRWVRARADGRQHEAGRSDIGAERDICGAIAEYAVSRYFNISWSPAVGFLDTHQGDLPGLQVKSITRLGLSLIVKPDDDERFPFVLVMLDFNAPTATLLGWISGKDAKCAQWFRKQGEPGIHQSAYFVPAQELFPISELTI